MDSAEDQMDVELDTHSSDESPEPSNQQKKRDEKKLQEELRRLDIQRQKQLKAAQKKMLEALREKQNKEISDAQGKSNKDRLRFLLEQTEIFSHFVKGGVEPSIDPKPDATGDGNSNVRRRRTSKEMADSLDEDELACDEPSFITRWTVSPSFVQGGQLKDYQIAGLNWLIRLYDNGINGILADEMGLGKTLQTLSFLCYLKEVRGINGPHLVIVPKSTLPNWLKEFEKWVPSMRVIGFHGDKDTRAKIRNEDLQPGKFDVVVTTYEIAIKEKSALKKFTWRYLVIDEAHRIKNEKSVLSQVVRLYDSQYRLLLTGTPLQNNLHELWALLNFLLPDVFSSAEDFNSWFDLTEKDNQQEVVNRLHKVLRPFLLRRLKSEVARGLPPKTEIKVFVGMSAMQRQWYRNILMKDIDAINSAGAGAGTKTRLLNILMQLRKVTNHPYLFPGAEPQPYEEGEHLITNAGKMVVLDKLLKRLKERGSRVLLFSQMTRLLDILEDYCVYRNFEYCRIDGSTDSGNRAEQIDEFNSENSTKFIFLLSTRAGGLGINLATADTVILYDSDWNPQVDLQAQDRAHRIGQTKPVTVYRFVTEGTVEEKIVERAEMKLKLDALVIQQGRLVDQNKPLNKDEMLSMIRFGADQILQAKDSTITDEEIDAIIAKSQQRTEELDSKLQQRVTSLLDLAISNTEFNIFSFEGVDYSEKSRTKLQFVELPRRETKAKISSFAEKPQRSQSHPKNARPPKVPQIYPHQFYPKRLQELIDKQIAAWRAKQEKEQKKTESTEGEDEKEKEEQDVPALTPQEEEEQRRLLAEGFGDWTKRDFQQFIKACSEYGRHNYAEIAKEVGTKTDAQVRKYAEVFWRNYKQLDGWQRIIETIEKGEKRIKQREEMVQALRKKVASTKDPWTNLRLVYPPGSKGGYTEEEDSFLVCALDKVGYGNWEDLQREIRRAWQFRWDWYLRSRSVDELKRRCEVLIRHIQKEFEAKKQQKTAASNSSKSKEKTDTNDASEAASKKTTKDSTSKSKSKSKAPAAAKATAATATKKRKREEQADTSSTRRASKRVKK